MSLQRYFSAGVKWRLYCRLRVHFRLDSPVIGPPAGFGPAVGRGIAKVICRGHDRRHGQGQSRWYEDLIRD